MAWSWRYPRIVPILAGTHYIGGLGRPISGICAPFAAARFLLLAIRAEADKQPLPDVLAAGGTPVPALQKPRPGRLFLSGRPLGPPKRKRNLRPGGMEQGSSVYLTASILSETAGARDELEVLQRLNRTACIDG